MHLFVVRILGSMLLPFTLHSCIIFWTFTALYPCFLLMLPYFTDFLTFHVHTLLPLLSHI